MINNASYACYVLIIRQYMNTCLFIFLCAKPLSLSQIYIQMFSKGMALKQEAWLAMDDPLDAIGISRIGLNIGWRDKKKHISSWMKLH